MTSETLKDKLEGYFFENSRRYDNISNNEIATYNTDIINLINSYNNYEFMILTNIDRYSSNRREGRTNIERYNSFDITTPQEEYINLLDDMMYILYKFNNKYYITALSLYSLHTPTNCGHDRCCEGLVDILSYYLKVNNEFEFNNINNSINYFFQLSSIDFDYDIWSLEYQHDIIYKNDDIKNLLLRRIQNNYNDENDDTTNDNTKNNNIKQVTYENFNTNYDDISNNSDEETKKEFVEEIDNTCPICLENEVTETTECNHKYCSVCLPKINKCAMCRFVFKRPVVSQLNTNQIHGPIGATGSSISNINLQNYNVLRIMSGMNIASEPSGPTGATGPSISSYERIDNETLQLILSGARGPIGPTGTRGRIEPSEINYNSDEENEEDEDEEIEYSTYIPPGFTSSLPERTPEGRIRVYAQNYNVLRIMSGMSGLAYDR